MAKDKKVTEISFTPGKPGPDPVGRRFNRNLAIAAREAVPAEIMLEYLLAIMEGHGQAVLKRDGRVSGGWVVSWPENGEIASTAEQKQWAWLQWRLAGYGQPAQQIVLEHELRAEIASARADVQVGQLPFGRMQAIRDLIRGRLAPGPIDAISTELEPAIASEDAGAIGLSESEEPDE